MNESHATQQLINEPTRRFISEHLDADVRQLALQGCRQMAVDMPMALTQIAGRQKARAKLPMWAACDDVVYPPHINMEQCSSEQAARYKAQLVSTMPRWSDGETARLSMIDLTGGFGVDFTLLAPLFKHATYVERDEHLCRVAKHNLSALGVDNAEAVCGEAADVLARTTHVSMIFVDPARRDAAGSKVVALADCSPDVTVMCDELLAKADVVVLKLSPMLDWHKAVDDMQHSVREVHVVSVRGECKELLLVCSRHGEGLRVVCSNDSHVFAFDGLNMPAALTGERPTPTDATLLLVPDSSVMKAGCFGVLEQRFGIIQLAENSHLFLLNADATPADFPGKAYRVKTITTMNRRALRTALAGVQKANIATRNFPITPDKLRRQLSLRDGGDLFIFATTDSRGQHLLIMTEMLK